jgi:hypothetical protein
MKNVTSKPEPSHLAIESNSRFFDDSFDPIDHPPRRPSISRLSFSSAARASAAWR